MGEEEEGGRGGGAVVMQSTLASPNPMTSGGAIGLPVCVRSVICETEAEKGDHHQ